jgi:hypothetical protein
MDKLKTQLFVCILLLIVSLCGCETKKSELHSQSPDGLTHITIYGAKSAMEPWDLTIEIKADKKSDSLKTQLYGDEINEKNILFDWQNNNSCIITLIDQDDTQRSIELSL